VSSLEFTLFRVNVSPSNQLKLWPSKMGPSDILKMKIQALPSIESTRGSRWHIGNVEALDEKSSYFRIGRVSSATVEVFKDGKFADQEFERAPYTHAVIDNELEVVAIAKKFSLSPNVHTVASQLCRLLNDASRGSDIDASFEIDTIDDPEDFITHLKKADAIGKFWITFARPNPLDADADFQKPLQAVLRSLNGDRGRTDFRGEGLDAEGLSKLARSAAATGNDAGAALRTHKGSKMVKKRLKGNVALVLWKELIDKADMLALVADVRKQYRKIRYGTPDPK